MPILRAVQTGPEIDPRLERTQLASRTCVVAEKTIVQKSWRTPKETAEKNKDENCLSLKNVSRSGMPEMSSESRDESPRHVVLALCTYVRRSCFFQRFREIIS